MHLVTHINLWQYHSLQLHKTRHSSMTIAVLYIKINIKVYYTNFLSSDVMVIVISGWGLTQVMGFETLPLLDYYSKDRQTDKHSIEFTPAPLYLPHLFPFVFL